LANPLAELNLGYTKVYAPVDGYLTNVNTSPGAYVHVRDQLLALVDSSSFWIAAYFKETQLPSIKPDRRVKITLMGYRDLPFEGKVNSVARNAAVAEVGEHRHELQGPVAFAAWLGVHAALLTTARAKIETFLEWGWDYFGKAHADPVLDRASQANINWNADEEKQEQPGLKNEG
jgi:NADH dehydrogenase